MVYSFGYRRRIAVSKQLENSVKQLLKHINLFVEKNTTDHIEEVEAIVSDLFEAEFSKFWRYDDALKNLKLLGAKNTETIALQSAFTREAVDHKHIVFANHITSDKRYQTNVDNPLDLKIRSLLIFPILFNARTIGVIKIWRGVKQKKNFNKKDDEVLQKLAPLFVNLFKNEKISKEILVGLQQGETVSARSDKPVNKPKPKDVGTVGLIQEQLDEERKSKRALESIIQALQSNEEALLGRLEKSQKKLQKRESELLLEIESAEKKLKKNENKLLQQIEESEKIYKKLESSSRTLTSELTVSQKREKELREQLSFLKKENQILREEKKQKEQAVVPSIQELKRQNTQENRTNNRKLDHNVEHLLQEVDVLFKDNDYSYLMFELIIYAFSSKEGLKYVEEFIRNSGALHEILYQFFSKSPIKINEEKVKIAELTQYIQKLEKHVFSEVTTINIEKDRKMPLSLVFDAPKIQSITKHILTDLYQDIDPSQPVNVTLAYENKTFTMGIYGGIQKKNSLLNTMLKQLKDEKNEGERVGIELSRKLIKRMRGDLDVTLDNGIYSATLKIPVKTIKI